VQPADTGLDALERSVVITYPERRGPMTRERERETE